MLPSNLTLDELIRLGRVPPEIVEAIEKERWAWYEYVSMIADPVYPEPPKLIAHLTPR